MPIPEIVTEAAYKAIKDGFNLYAPPHGVNVLREAISIRVNNLTKFLQSSKTSMLFMEQPGALSCMPNLTGGR